MIFYHDFETRSEQDLSVVGTANYVADKSTKVLMLSYALDDSPVKVWLPHQQPEIPEEVLIAMHDPNVTKVAFNAGFEQQVWEKVLGISVDTNEWRDVMIMARYLSIPGGLEEIGRIIGLKTEDAKIKRGKELIHTFSEPFRKGGKITLFGVSDPEFHTYQDKPFEWEEYVDYSRQDTHTLRVLHTMFAPFLYPQSEHEYWVTDQAINRRGIPVNVELVKTAYAMAEASQTHIMNLFSEMTKLENPNSRNQLLPWLQAHGYPYNSLRKDWVSKALKEEISLECKKALLYRQEASKTSFKKFASILSHLSSDGRVRDLFAFMGAARTGRWSGHGVQFQNLPRPIKIVEKNLDKVLELISKGDTETLLKDFVPVNETIKEKIPSVISVISSCIRSVFQAQPGHKFLVCDLNAIENRVLGWLAGCENINKVFREGRCPYLSFAAEGMYKVPYDSMVKIVDGIHKPIDEKASERRQTAKPAVLGAGYELGHGTKMENGIRVAKTHLDKWGNVVKEGLIAYAENMGVKLTPEESYLAVTSFREFAPEVSLKPRKGSDLKPGLWWQLEEAAKSVLSDGGTQRVSFVEFSRVRRANGRYILRIKLPSGRYLHYINARLEPYTFTDKRGHERDSVRIAYDGIGHGVGATTDKIVWGTVYTYGGKLTENIVQAISRDLIAYMINQVEYVGGNVVGHVHDEIIVEVLMHSLWFTFDDLKRIMSTTPSWALGLLLGADGYEGPVYKKG